MSRGKRVIRIQVSIDGNDVVCNQTTFRDEMGQEDGRDDGKFFKKRMNAHENGKINAGKRKRGEPINNGEYVEVRSNPVVPDHPTVHLFTKPGDEIEWFTEDDIQFVVNIQRDPELVRLLPNTSLGITPNRNIDNPFIDPGRFPLQGSQEESVFSGPFAADSDDSPFARQMYYKYTVEVAGKNSFDPDVEGHFGD